jgi:ribulose-phosphate 3-epimerase
MKKTILTPSLPAASFDELKKLATLLAPHVPMFQVDLVDGDFAPSRSWPFTEATDPRQTLEALQPLCELMPIEVDLMIMHPEEYLDVFAAVGVSSVVVHVGTTDAYDAIIDHARAHCYAIGLAVTNDVPTQALDPYISRIDFVQVMGIKTVGKQGQPFDPRTIATLTRLRVLYPDLPLVVDGAVNVDTIGALVAAGATRVAPGSAIAHAADPVAAYKQLSEILSQ